MEGDSRETLSCDDRAAIEAGLDSLEKHAAVPTEVIFAELGLTVAEFDDLPEFLPHD